MGTRRYIFYKRQTIGDNWGHDDITEWLLSTRIILIKGEGILYKLEGVGGKFIL